jgi:hypothetical protein
MAARLPPLFYTDIEPEIRSITSPPPNIRGVSSIFTVEEITTLDAVLTEAAKKAKVSTGNRKQTKQKQSLLVQQQNASIKTSSLLKEESRISSTPSTRTTTSPTTTEIVLKPDYHKPHKAIWLERYNELKDYYIEHGHCILPQVYAPNPKLGLWVMQQRRQYTFLTRGKQSSFNGPDGMRRIRMLEDIDFVWRVGRGSGCRHPTSLNKSLQRSLYHHHHNVVKKSMPSLDDEIIDAVDFESYLLGKRRECSYSDEELREAWRHRFILFK